MKSRRKFIESSLAACGIASFANRGHALQSFMEADEKELLPEGWELYSAPSGQVLFQVYGSNGAIACRHLCWLRQSREGKTFSVPVEFTQMEIDSTSAVEMQEMCRLKLEKAIREEPPTLVNMDGGNMPMPRRDREDPTFD